MTLDAWLAQGPFTLALSSSFFGFFAHAGVVRALEERGYRPAKVTGASAGALVGGALASGMSGREMGELLFRVKREDFWDPALGLGLLKGEKFARYIAPYFAKSFTETRLPLEVSVFDLFSLKTRFIKTGPLVPAVVASCAIPLFFHPSFAGGRVLLDGGLLHKSAINGPPEERILCIYLESTGLSGIYEKAMSFARLSPNHKVIRFRRLPRVTPGALERGREAFSMARERASAALGQILNGNFVET